MEKRYMDELRNMPEDDEEESRIDLLGGMQSKMTGLSDQFKNVKRKILMQECGKKAVYALVGTAGVGKTTLAGQIFQDPEIKSYFKHRAWVRVGRKHQLDQLSRDILVQLFEIALDEAIDVDDLEEMFERKKCLIVLDDVWEQQIMDPLIDSLPYIKRGLIQILVTAREWKVIKNSREMNSFYTIEVVRFLNEEESKDLLCEKVFGEEMCPPQLDKAATEIANSCEGLPLMIVTVAGILSVNPQNRDPRYWNDVAEMRNSVFTDAYNDISKVLFPSYDYLPRYLKMLFLYMGVFSPEYDIPPSKIINMLTAEGWFVHTNKKQPLEGGVRMGKRMGGVKNLTAEECFLDTRKKSLEVSLEKCLDELCMDKNLVLYNRKSIFWYGNIHSGMLRACRLHSTWRHVCRGEARKNKFYHVFNKLVDAPEQGQRGLCLHNNILFGIKDFCNSVKMNGASSARSVLFYGPYHQYPVQIDVGFRLLRELDALKQRFYTFPTEILSLVHLKYLAPTCNGEIPTTISKLFILQVLIIHPHMNIRCRRAPSYVPIQIWDMQELVHIEILGKSLVAPSHVASLEKLSTLIGVNASISTILELSKRIPNIRKLGIQIERMPYDDHDDLLSCFGCISTLGSLRTLKCSIINPVVPAAPSPLVVAIRYDVPAAPSTLMLPRRLKKLHLSGMGFPWEYMDAIGSLEFLKVLKLRSYAFQGSKWETKEEHFPRLEFLLIEDSDLEQWGAESGSFPELAYLSLKHCYKLKMIRWQSVTKERKMELVDCNPSALKCAEQLQVPSYGSIEVTGSSSFDEKPIAINFERYGELCYIAVPEKPRLPKNPRLLDKPLLLDKPRSLSLCL